MKLRWPPLAIAMSATLGVVLAAVAGLWEPGWGVVAASVLLCATLAAGVVRDPDGPEIHVFLGCAMALVAGFVITHAAVVIAETERAQGRALPGQGAIVRAVSERIRENELPKWAVMAGGIAIGAGALVVRARRRKR